MKKRSDSRIVRVITNIINVPKWFDWERVKVFTLYLGNGLKRLFVPQKNTATESFDEAVKKLNLSEENLLVKQKSLFRLCIIMLLSAVLIWVYACYQLFSGSFKAFIISLVVTLIALVLSFRYHFWYFQIKQRKLGCTFNEWLRQGLLGARK